MGKLNTYLENAFRNACIWVAVFLLLGLPVVAVGQVPNVRPNPNFPGNEQVNKGFGGFLGAMLIIAVMIFIVSAFALVNNLRKGRDGNVTGPAWGVGGSIVFIFLLFSYATFLNGAVAFLN